MWSAPKSVTDKCVSVCFVSFLSLNPLWHDLIISSCSPEHMCSGVGLPFWFRICPLASLLGSRVTGAWTKGHNWHMQSWNYPIAKQLPHSYKWRSKGQNMSHIIYSWGKDVIFKVCHHLCYQYLCQAKDHVKSVLVQTQTTVERRQFRCIPGSKDLHLTQ